MDIKIYALICVVLGGMGQGIVAPKLPQLLEGAGELATASGISATLMYFGIFLSTGIYGKLADRGYLQKVMVLGLFFYALCLTCIGLSSHAPYLIAVLRFFEGISLCAIFVSADVVLGRFSKIEERGRWLSYYGIALSIGLVLGPTLSLLSGRLGTLMGLDRGLSEAPLFPLAIASVLAVGLGGFGLKLNWKELLPGDTKSKPLQWIALIPATAYGFMESGVVAIFPILAVTQFHVIPEYCFIVSIVSAAISSLLWGMVIDFKKGQWTSIVLLIFFGFGSCALSFITPMMKGTVTAYSASIFFGILAGGLYPAGFSWLLEGIPQRQYGGASAQFSRAYGLGSLVGPFFAGWVSQSLGAQGLFLVMFLVGLLSLSAVLGNLFFIEK